ncbi:hypothetical protein MRX96_031269 [Rhipicephalus microplus]
MTSAASSSGVKKRRALSLEIKECVIRDIESGLKKASLAAKYGVSDTTVSTIYKNKDKLRQQLQQDSSSLSRKRIRTSKYEDVDAPLFRWFHEVRAQSNPVSGPMLLQKAKCLGALSDHDDLNPLNGCIQRFKDHYGISCKVVCGESGAVDDESIEAKADTMSKCFKRAGFVRNAQAPEDDEQCDTSLADETLNTDDVCSCLVDSNFVTATDTFQEFVDAGESELSVCEEASTDGAIVATGAKNSLSEKSLQCLSFVEDEIVSKHRQTKITTFFR